MNTVILHLCRVARGRTIYQLSGCTHSLIATCLFIPILDLLYLTLKCARSARPRLERTLGAPAVMCTVLKKTSQSFL